jgi:Transaldolase/Fructose-6-phosphate aldolase/NDH2 C-terminal domain
LGQSLWLDNITRDLLDGGTLRRYVDELSVTGLTSNPTIFDHAIKNSIAYDAAIREKLGKGKSGEALFFELALDDITRAADLFRAINDRTNTVDGWVSLEVSPLLAHDTTSTLAAAKDLSARAKRPNLFIKIPGTKEGLPAIAPSSGVASWRPIVFRCRTGPAYGRWATARSYLIRSIRASSIRRRRSTPSARPLCWRTISWRQCAARLRQPFKFKIIGLLATIGGRTGVAEILGVRFSGFIAWWLWRGIYLIKLPGFQKKVRVALDWILNLIFSKDIVQLPTLRSPTMSEAEEPVTVPRMHSKFRSGERREQL